MNWKTADGEAYIFHQKKKLKMRDNDGRNKVEKIFSGCSFKGLTHEVRREQKESFTARDEIDRNIFQSEIMDRTTY